MSMVRNLCPWPNATVNCSEWNLVTTQDKQTGLWTYTLRDGANIGTAHIFTLSIQYGVEYVAMMESATPMKNAGMGFNDGGRVKDITVTDTLHVGSFTVEKDGGRFNQIYLWLTGTGATITPRHVGLYTLDDWNILQSKNMSWFAGDTMPLS